MPFFHRLMFFAGVVFAIQFSQAQTVDFITYGPLGESYSGELALILESLSKNPEGRLKILNSEKGMAYRKGDIYLLSKENKSVETIENSWRSEVRQEKSFYLFESQRSLMLVPYHAPSDFLDYIQEQKKGFSQLNSDRRYWQDLKFSEVRGGRIEASVLDYFNINRRDWRVEKKWNFAFYLTYQVEFAGNVFPVTILPKGFGGLGRTAAAIKSVPEKKKWIFGTGGITPSKEDLDSQNNLEALSKLGEQYVAVDYGDLIGKVDFIDPYTQKWNGSPPIHFLSANVYEKKQSLSGQNAAAGGGDGQAQIETKDGASAEANSAELAAGQAMEQRMFSPYEVLGVDGREVAIIGLTSPEIQASLEKHVPLTPWLQNVVIKDPVAVLRDELIPKLRSQVDMIIVLANLTPQEMGVLTRDVEGLDLIVHAQSRNFSPGSRRKVENDDYQKRVPKLPLIVIPTSFTTIGITKLQFKGGAVEITQRETVLDQKFPADREESAVEDAVSGTEVLRNIFLAKNIVLPDHRKIYPEKVTVGQEDFANLAAELMRRNLRAEVGIFNIQYQRSDMTGELDSAIVKTWIRPEERISTMYISGADLSALVNLNKTLADPYRLAIVGIDGEGKINGNPLQPKELYRIAASTAVTENTEKYPMMAGAVEKRLKFVKTNGEYSGDTENGSAVSLADFVIEGLQEQWTELQKASPEERHAAYKKLYEAQSAPGEGYWVHDFKSIRLEYSRLRTTNLADFQNVADSRLIPADQDVIGTSLAYSASYRKNPYITELGVRGQFSKLTVRPENEAAVENVLADDLVFFANIGFPIFQVNKWTFLGSRMGPVLEAAYDTEFERSPGLQLEKSVQAFAGWRFYGGTLFQSITLAALNETHLTRGSEKNEWGANVRAELAKPFLDGKAVWRSELDFRYYFDGGGDSNEDLCIRFVWDNYLDLNLFGKLSFGPYFKYFTFSGKTFDETGTQTIIGFNLNLSSFWKPKYQASPF